MYTIYILLVAYILLETSGSGFRNLFNYLLNCKTLNVFYRILLMLERYRKAIAPLPVRIVPENVFCTRLSSLPELPPDRICLQFIKEEMYYLVSFFAVQV